MSAITWSNRSRRQLAIQRSATPFCQGHSNEVRRGDRQGSNGSRNLCSIFATAVKDKKPRRRFKRKRLPQLLLNPPARRVLGNVEVQNLPSIVPNDEKAVKHSEGDGGDGKEVHRSDGFPMIAEKRQPTLGGFRIPRRPFIQRETVRSETSNPSRSSSPWMRGAPQVGLSATIRKIRSRTCWEVGLLPIGPLALETHF